MPTPHVSVLIERNPKHDTIESKRLLDCVQSAVTGTFQGYFGLSPTEQSLMKSVHMTFLMANDGATPVNVVIDLEIDSNNSIEWNEHKKFGLYKFAEHEPDYLRDSIREHLQQNLREVIEARCKLLQSHINALRKKPA